MLHSNFSNSLFIFVLIFLKHTVTVLCYIASSLTLLQRHSVSSACTSNKNLRDLLTSTKSRQPALHTSNVIYQIPCKDCSATYCGQTSRPLHKRISEHERYTRPAYSHATDLQQSSALAQHAHASGIKSTFHQPPYLPSSSTNSSLTS